MARRTVVHWPPRAPVALWSLALVAGLVGCGSDPVAPDPEPTGCGAGEIELDDGSCFPAAIAPDRCGVGFEGDGRGGCVAIVPAAPCPAGAMAVPGETACREVAPCGSAPWGEIPVDGATVYVDAAYPGSDSDGSASRPFVSLDAAAAAAAPGALIAMAEGSYPSALDLQKPLRVWGRCPSLVEIVGTSSVAAVVIRANSDGTELHGLAIRGTANGVQMSGSSGVMLDRVWIHDLGGVGIAVVDDFGPGGILVSSSLIENVSRVGVYLVGDRSRHERPLDEAAARQPVR